MYLYHNGIGFRRGHCTGVIPWPQHERSVTVTLAFHFRTSYHKTRGSGLCFHAAFHDSPISNGSKLMKIVTEFRRSTKKQKTQAPGAILGPLSDAESQTNPAAVGGWQAAQTRQLSHIFKTGAVRQCKDLALKASLEELDVVSSAIRRERDAATRQIEAANRKLDIIRDAMLIRASWPAAPSSSAPSSECLPQGLGSVNDSDTDLDDLEPVPSPRDAPH